VYDSRAAFNKCFAEMHSKNAPKKCIVKTAALYCGDH